MTVTMPVEIEIDVNAIREDIVSTITTSILKQLQSELKSGQLIKQIKNEIKADMISQNANKITNEIVTSGLQDMIKEASLKLIVSKVSNLSIKIQ